ncbi:MAG: nicotinate-nucleotide adenylyltransferase [Coriobacteriia bacterium]|nr:nicotinate-nucleotide adenylyltransferase [Coriobacteriia bacterium]
MTQRIGIMGGTFDPIHIGHLVTAQEVYERFDLDKVIFMVAGKHPLKQRHVTPAGQRLEMVEIAIRDNPHFEASDYEVKRKKVTYTVDTLRHLHNVYPEDVEFYFITGADALFEIIEWKDAHELAEMTILVGATRPGYTIEQAQQRHEHAEEKFDIRYLEVPALAVSSTDVRHRVEQGRDVRYLVTDGVADYIRAHNLYTGK